MMAFVEAIHYILHASIIIYYVLIFIIERNCTKCVVECCNESKGKEIDENARKGEYATGIE